MGYLDGFTAGWQAAGKRGDPPCVSDAGSAEAWLGIDVTPHDFPPRAGLPHAGSSGAWVTGELPQLRASI